MAPNISRRAFLMTGAALGGSALVAAVGGVGFLATLDVDGLHGSLEEGRANINAFLAIQEDGRVIVNVPKTEMGQGIHTGLAMVVAEELDIPFDERISVEFPTEAHPAYSTWFNMLQVRPEEAGNNPVVWLGRRVLGQLGFIATGASGSTMGMWHPMRVAGAAARQMLMTAAAARFDVPIEDLTTGEGFVYHPASGQSLAYGTLARDAAVLQPPGAPGLRPKSAWKLIGRSQKRLDIPGKVRGDAMFGLDVTLPDMLHAAIRHAPVFRANVAAVRNTAEVMQMPGVIDVAVINERQVAVVADSWWRAEQAAQALSIEWTQTEFDTTSSATMTEQLLAALDAEDPHEHIDDGDVETAFGTDNPGLEAVYTVPFVTHACMEPMNATVIVRDDGSAEAWVPSQSPIAIRAGMRAGTGWAGVTPSSITCNVTMNGGAFGRRSDQDVVAQAAFLAARHQGRPVKLLWSREEDMTSGLFRSHAAARLRAVLGPDGMPEAYDATVAAQSVMEAIGRRNLPITPSPHGDRINVEGLDKLHYAIPNRRMRSQHVPGHLEIGFWRSNGFSFNTFFTESFVDECALAAGQDPLAYRQTMLRDSPRHLAVLNRVARMAGWDSPLPAGRGRGIAIEECYRSVVAQVVEVTISEDGEITLDRVFCAVDVGLVINPDAVIAQMEGGIIFGLTAALGNEITIENGAVVQSNFHDFPMLRIADSPKILVEIVESDEPPGGAGEPGIVPVAAALGNAIHAATGRRLRSLPLAVTETIGERRTRRVLPQVSVS